MINLFAAFVLVVTLFFVICFFVRVFNPRTNQSGPFYRSGFWFLLSAEEENKICIEWIKEKLETPLEERYWYETPEGTKLITKSTFWDYAEIYRISENVSLSIDRWKKDNRGDLKLMGLIDKVEEEKKNQIESAKQYARSQLGHSMTDISSRWPREE